MRILREVAVYRTADDELLAVSQAAGIVGEEMSLDLIAAAGAMSLKVRVLDSRPVILAGSMRHRLRLGVVADVAHASIAASGLATTDVETV